MSSDFETDKTMLVQLVYSETDREDLIIKLPKKITIIADLYKGHSQFILYTDEIKPNPDKDLKYIVLSLTNDPYSSHAGDVNNLGYFRLLWRVGFGVNTSTSPFTYITNDINTLMITENIPLRYPTHFKGNIGIRFLEEDYNTYQIIEYRFKDDLTQDINIKYSIFNYTTNKSKSIEKNINLFSAYNKYYFVKEFESDNMNDVFIFHEFKKLNK